MLNYKELVVHLKTLARGLIPSELFAQVEAIPQEFKDIDELHNAKAHLDAILPDIGLALDSKKSALADSVPGVEEKIEDEDKPVLLSTLQSFNKTGHLISVPATGNIAESEPESIMNAKRKETALAVLIDLHNELLKIANPPSSESTRTSFEKLKRWKARAVVRVTKEISEIEGENLHRKQKGSFRMGDPEGNLADELEMYEGFLLALRDELEAHPDDVLNRAVPPPSGQLEAVTFTQPTGNAIFLVHGHDPLNLYRLKELLRDRYRLETIVLMGEAGKGRTLIEKFEEEAQRAAFAFVLLTPDDVIKKKDMEYGQARPNVIFELGWFYGRLSRSKVCILFKEGTKIHSDLDGISRIEFRESVAEKIDEIERELVSGKILVKRG